MAVVYRGNVVEPNALSGFARHGRSGDERRKQT